MEESLTFNKKSGILEYVGKQIKTLDDLLSQAKVDTEEWRVKSWKPNSWNTSFKVKEEGEDVIKIITNFQVTAQLERKPELFAKKLAAQLVEDIRNHAPQVKKIARDSTKKNLVLEIALADLHFGRVCHKVSDGGEYNTKKAHSLAVNAVREIVDDALKYGKLNEIILWVAGDFFNCDNFFGTTTKGTPQQNGESFPSVFRKGKDLLVEIVDEIKEHCPVEIVFSVGNHDENSLFHLGEVIDAWFSKDSNVTIDNSLDCRKYRKVGDNLIMFSHGDKALKKLGTIAAGECPFWSECRYREVHVGHLHHERVEVMEGSAVKTRVMPTISCPDKYHNDNGYVNNLRQFQGFLWHKKHGLQNILFSKPIFD